MSAVRRTPRRFEEVCRNAKNSRADFPAAVVMIVVCICARGCGLQLWFVVVVCVLQLCLRFMVAIMVVSVVMVCSL